MRDFLHSRRQVVLTMFVYLIVQHITLYRTYQAGVVSSFQQRQPIGSVVHNLRHSVCRVPPCRDAVDCLWSAAWTCQIVSTTTQQPTVSSCPLYQKEFLFATKLSNEEKLRTHSHISCQLLVYLCFSSNSVLWQKQDQTVDILDFCASLIGERSIRRCLNRYTKFLNHLNAYLQNAL